MDSQSWLTCTSLELMLDVSAVKSSARKLRLFACACCRDVWHLLTHERSRNAVEVAEQFADGKATKKQLDAARDAARDAAWGAAWDAARGAARGAAWDAAWVAARDAASSAAWDAARDAAWDAAWDAAREKQCSLLRDVFGILFADRAWLIHRCPSCGQEHSWVFRASDDAPGEWPRCPGCDIEMRHRVDLWRQWQEQTVPRLAQAIYECRAFERMPILADALEEAGCDDRQILEHCRGPGPHVRGCWVLDLILGME